MNEPPRIEGLPLGAAAEMWGPPDLLRILREAVAAGECPDRQTEVYLPTVPAKGHPARAPAIAALTAASRLALLKVLRSRLIAGKELIAFGLRIERGKQPELARSMIPPAWWEIEVFDDGGDIDFGEGVRFAKVRVYRMPDVRPANDCEPTKSHQDIVNQWMLERATKENRKLKKPELMDACRTETGATWREALAAYQSLPPHFRYKGGRPKN